MEPKVSYTLVGLFVIVLGAGLLSVVLWLGREGEDKVYDLSYIHMQESVSGLSVNAPVKYRGVEVGRVKRIELDRDNPEQVQLMVEIARGTPLKTDTVATLSSQGLTGLSFVELSGGTANSAPLTAAAGQRYPEIRSRPSLLVRMDEAVSTLLTNLNGITTNLDALVDTENRTSIKELLKNLAGLSETLAAREGQLDQLLASAGDAIKNTDQITAKVPVLISRMTESVTAFQAMAQDIGRTSQAVNTLVTSNQQNIERFAQQTLADVSLLVGELRQLTNSLQGLARQLEQEPNSLLFGRRPLPRGPGE
jgi:phospholipid/cholesterol/gamma-HCH transport system substrate-binding protein